MVVKKRFILYAILWLFQSTLKSSETIHRKFVLTGGPGVGKSSVIKELEKQGYQVSPEAFTELYDEVRTQGKLDTLFVDPIKFRYDLMAKQQHLESLLRKEGLTFLDRSKHDIVFFGKYFGLKLPQDLVDEIQKTDLELVFFLDLLSKEYYENTNVRQESQEESLKIHNFLKEEYKKTGLKIIDVPFDTVENRVKFIVDSVSKFYFYSDIMDCFSGKNKLYKIENFLDQAGLIEIKDKNGTVKQRFFGIHKDNQQKLNFMNFKIKLAQLEDLNPKEMIQIVGDSGQFSKEGTIYVRKFLQKYLESSSIIEYGFTGYKNTEELDINSFVSEYVDKHPERGNSVIANILGHTHLALTKWGCYGSPYVKNYVVVYNDSPMSEEPKYNENGFKVSGYTTFGDDVIASDYILQSKDKDKLICVEGGAQSFRQVVNALNNDINIELVYNVRKPENNELFSTALFLKQINDLFVTGKVPSREAIEEVYKKYTSELKSMWNTKKPDYKTKKEIFDFAINEFMNKRLYEKINKLCIFYDAKDKKTNFETKSFSSFKEFSTKSPCVIL